MQITINTADPISDLDKQILSLITGGVVSHTLVKATVETEAEPVKVKPAKKAAKKPEPTPEPMAEEPLAEEPEAEEVEDDEVSDADLLDLAVKKATEMVANGDADKVREALDIAGANRVRELNKDNVRAFFKALS